MAEQGVLPTVSELRAQRKGEFKQGVKQAFGREEVEQEKDPVRREQIAAEELSRRAEARAPYRAPDAVPMAFERIATRGETQLAEVIEHLRTSGHAARPDLVFGVYRVPDRISGPLTPALREGPRRRVGDRPRAARPRRRPRERRARGGGDVVRRRGPVGRPPLRRAVRARRGPRPGLLRGGARGAGALPRPRALQRVPLAARRRLLRRGQRGSPRDRPRHRRAAPGGALRRVRPHARGRAARAAARAAARRPRRGPRLGDDRPRRPPAHPQAALRPLSLPLPPLHAAGAHARVPRGRRGPAAGLLRRAGHRRPPARADPGRLLLHEPRPEAAVRRRQAADAHPRVRADRRRLPRQRRSTPPAASAGRRTSARSSRRSCATASACGRRS